MAARARFTEHISRWVETVGGHPTTARVLVAFLDRLLGSFAPARVVAWLNSCWVQRRNRCVVSFRSATASRSPNFFCACRRDGQWHFKKIALRARQRIWWTDASPRSAEPAGVLRKTFETRISPGARQLRRPRGNSFRETQGTAAGTTRGPGGRRAATRSHRRLREMIAFRFHMWYLVEIRRLHER